MNMQFDPKELIDVESRKVADAWPVCRELL
jgi:hypothetical protein